METFKTLSITFDNEFYCGSGFGIGGYIDQLVCKDQNGVAYIPASTLKGKFRWAAGVILATLKSTTTAGHDATGDSDLIKYANEHFCLSDHDIPCRDHTAKNRCVLCRLFGSMLYPGLLIFEDAYPVKSKKEKISSFRRLIYAPINPVQNRDRFQVTINRKNRVARPQHLIHYEVTTGSEFFSSLYVENQATCELLQNDFHLLNACAKFIDHIGGKTAAGLGRCKIDIGEPQ